MPEDKEAISLTHQVLSKLEMNFKMIREQFFDRALNELESMDFYNTKWADRIEKLFRVNENKIIDLINKINSL